MTIKCIDTCLALGLVSWGEYVTLEYKPCSVVTSNKRSSTVDPEEDYRTLELESASIHSGSEDLLVHYLIQQYS